MCLESARQKSKCRRPGGGLGSGGSVKGREKDMKKRAVGKRGGSLVPYSLEVIIFW